MGRRRTASSTTASRWPTAPRDPDQGAFDGRRAAGAGQRRRSTKSSSSGPRPSARASRPCSAATAFDIAAMAERGLVRGEPGQRATAARRRGHRQGDPALRPLVRRGRVPLALRDARGVAGAPRPAVRPRDRRPPCHHRLRAGRVDHQHVRRELELAAARSGSRSTTSWPARSSVYGSFFGDSFTVEYPSGSGERRTPRRHRRGPPPAADLAVPRRRRRSPTVLRPGRSVPDDPRWRDYVQFNEYFHGDNGAGLGASHQTGWTGLVADLIRRAPGNDITSIADLLQPGRRVAGRMITRPGRAFPLGATPTSDGTNFAVASDVADGMILCLFETDGTEHRIPMLDYDAGVWHALVPGVGPGQRYGFRATGPWDPARGVRCVETKLLLDPYARAITGDVTFGPAVLGPRRARSGAAQPARLRRVDAAQSRRRSRPSTGPATHTPSTATPTPSSTSCTPRASRGCIPRCPPELQGTYAGLAHDAVVAAPRRSRASPPSNCCPCTTPSPRRSSSPRGCTNYWGYNTIGYFAPHEAYSADGSRRAPRRPGRGVQDDGHAAARGRARSHPRRRVQPHRRGRSHRPDAVSPRARQPGVLPPRPRRSAPLHRHHRLRQLAQRRPRRSRCS